MKTTKRILREWFFAITNIIVGMGSVYSFNWSSSDFNMPNTSQDSDYQALKNDWIAVGLDINNAMRTFDKDYDVNK